jgi:hypothetical protein
MKLTHKILILALILISIPILIPIFTAKDYSIQREITINKTKNEVFDFLRFLKNQDKFSKWANMDPNMEKSYTGVDGTVGFISSWKSKKEDVGSGEQEIKQIIAGERLEYEIRFIEPFEATDKASLTTESISPNQTKVVWRFDGRMDYPMNLMLLFMNFEKMIGDDLEIGLENLKSILEK